MPKHLAAYGLDRDVVLESDAWYQHISTQVIGNNVARIAADQTLPTRRRGEGRPLTERSLRELTSDVKERGGQVRLVSLGQLDGTKRLADTNFDLGFRVPPAGSNRQPSN